MASHPYISGPGNIAQMIGFLRKNFPATVNSETVKKFSLAPNNESYVINALQFIGVVDDEGKRTTKGHDIFVMPDDAFPKAFEGLIKAAYADLFEVRGEDAWALTKNELTAYFRTTDKTSEVIGGRQAGVFQIFRNLAGHIQPNEKSVINDTPKPKSAKSKTTPSKANKVSGVGMQDRSDPAAKTKEGRRDMAMTVRIEINLPANGSKETYDAIFKSIRANLIDE
jgi:Family of unknown function (DUF5343)